MHHSPRIEGTRCGPPLGPNRIRHSDDADDGASPAPSPRLRRPRRRGGALGALSEVRLQRHFSEKRRRRGEKEENAIHRNFPRLSIGQREKFARQSLSLIGQLLGQVHRLRPGCRRRRHRRRVQQRQ